MKVESKVFAKVFFAALVFVCFVCLGSCKGKVPEGMTVSKGFLSIALEATYPPMEYISGDGKTPAGFDVELGRVIARKLDLEPKLFDTIWDKIFLGLDDDKYDCVISSVTINPARQMFYDFSKPYIANSLAMVIKKNSNINVKSPEECYGLNVGFQTGTTADEYMSELGDKGLEYNPRGLENMIQCFNELYLDQVDVVLTDILVAYEFVVRQGSPFALAWQSDKEEKFGVCVKKGNSELLAAINKALDELWDDGTLLKISQDTFGMDLITPAWNQF